MAITKQKKGEIVEKLKDIFAKSPAVAFVQFNKLNVANAQALRRKLREASTGYFVAKKTLIKKALAEAGVTGTMPALDGEVAVAYSADITAPAREAYTFQKKFKDQYTIIGGVFEGAYKSKEEMMAIATIPPLKTLYAQLANLLNSPIQGFVMALDQIAQKQESASGAPAAPVAEAVSAAPVAA